MKDLGISIGLRRAVTLRDREIMFEMYVNGLGIRKIARRLGRSHSVVSRELKRNWGNSLEWERASAFGKAQLAHEKAKKRRKTKRCRERLKSHWIRRVVEHLIVVKHLTPEQVSGFLKRNHTRLYVCKEAIYQWIQHDARHLIEYLYCGGKKYKKNRVKNKRKKKSKKAAVEKTRIDKRPKEVEDRTVPGHWEGDAIVCKQSTCSILNTTERVSRMIFATKIPDCTAESGEIGFLRNLENIPKELRKSLTLDNGGENANHAKISTALKIDIYFCHSYCSWEKGAIENRNRFIRRFVKKGTDLSKLPEWRLQEIVELHNNTPLKCLDFRTPKEVFTENVIKLQQELPQVTESQRLAA